MAFWVENNHETHGAQRLEQEPRSDEWTKICYIHAVSLKLKCAKVRKCCIGASLPSNIYDLEPPVSLPTSLTSLSYLGISLLPCSLKQCKHPLMLYSLFSLFIPYFYLSWLPSTFPKVSAITSGDVLNPDCSSEPDFQPPPRYPDVDVLKVPQIQHVQNQTCTDTWYSMG